MRQAAIEFGGHKALTLPHTLGKLSAETIAHAMDVYNGDANREHTVMPGMVYLSHPTEYGTLYSLEELTAIRQVCLPKTGCRSIWTAHGLPMAFPARKMT